LAKSLKEEKELKRVFNLLELSSFVIPFLADLAE